VLKELGGGDDHGRIGLRESQERCGRRKWATSEFSQMTQARCL
jgi:hypothetical protein